MIPGSSSTVEESRKSVRNFEGTLRYVLQINPQLSQRTSSINSDTHRGSRSYRTSQAVLNVSERASLLNLEGDSISNPLLPRAGQEKLAFGFDKEVEEGLSSSFAYSRAGRRLPFSQDRSSSTASRMGWSFFSQISLAEISNLSVISLPISIQELWDSEQYIPNAIRDSKLISSSMTESDSEEPGSSTKSERSASTGRQIISAPVMAENSLGWNLIPEGTLENEHQ